MEWLLLIVGAILGVVFDRLFRLLIEDRVSARRRQTRYRKLNEAWGRSELTSGALRVVQTGWDDEGCFAPGSIQVRLVGDYEPHTEVKRFRESHRDDWTRDGLTDGVQVGVRSLVVRRESDEPEVAHSGAGHSLRMDGHTYRYYDFLASHRLRLLGDDDEKAVLNALASGASSAAPVSAFPTPVSVGLSFLADGGDSLVLVRRSVGLASGGWWQPGALYNAVGEGAAPRDVSADPISGAKVLSAEGVAARGLHEEVGLTAADLAITTIRLHTLAWASDLLDYKFFGHAITPLSVGEVIARQQTAPDRAEGDETVVLSVAKRTDCLALIAKLRSLPTAWSPEAIVGTLRTLVVLRRINAADLAR